MQIKLDENDLRDFLKENLKLDQEESYGGITIKLMLKKERKCPYDETEWDLVNETWIDFGSIKDYTLGR